jgi:hypothetical protein
VACKVELSENVTDRNVGFEVGHYFCRRWFNVVVLNIFI